MFEAPWEARVYRNRHGRGVRAPMFGARLPRYRTRTGQFDDMVAAQVRRLHEAWPELVQPVQFAVEDVPPSDLAPWESKDCLMSRSFTRRHGIPPRIVVYRLPLQSKARDRIDLQFLIRDEIVARLAEIYGRRPEDIDPGWKL